jgi:t-SNARE complex subunit (syntaxin)
MDNQKHVEDIENRIVELSKQAMNHRLDIIKYKTKYEKKFNIKYAQKVIQAENAIHNIIKKINKYKKIKKTFEDKNVLQ